MRSAPILHRTDKECVVSFRHNGQFISLKRQRFKTRQEALTHIKAYYRGASQISIVFYVPNRDIGT